MSIQEMSLDDLRKALPSYSIHKIAEIVWGDWEQPYFGAKPYMEAMATMQSINDNYGADSGEEIVIYFLANAKTWRGPIARVVKFELNRRLKTVSQ